MAKVSGTRAEAELTPPIRDADKQRLWSPQADRTITLKKVMHQPPKVGKRPMNYQRRHRKAEESPRVCTEKA